MAKYFRAHCPLHCKHTDTPWVRVGCFELGCLDSWALLGFSGVAGGDGRPVQTLRPKNWEAKGEKEAWKVGKCTLQFAGVEAPPGSQACPQLDRLVLPRPTTRLQGGKERTLGLGFRAVRFGDADWGGGLALSGDFSLCLVGARVSTGTRPKPSEREPWERRCSSYCAVLALVSLPCSLVPSIPGTPVPPCLPRLLHRSRFPTAHHLHLAFRQLERALHWATGRV